MRYSDVSRIAVVNLCGLSVSDSKAKNRRSDECRKFFRPRSADNLYEPAPPQSITSSANN
jgi:hypothetical protein